MSWSDDEWDADEALKKAEKAKAEWDESSEEEKKPDPKPAPKPKSKKKKEEKKQPEYDVALEDPVAEKMRRQKLVEEADQRLAADLFSDCGATSAKKQAGDSAAATASSQAAAPKVQYVVHDTFEQLELKTQKDVEDLCSRCTAKINENPTLKAGAAHKFIYDLYKALEGDLKKEELEALEKTVGNMLKEKKVSKSEVDANKRKTNEKLNKNTKFNVNDEMATVYGDGKWDEYNEEDYYEDY